MFNRMSRVKIGGNLDNQEAIIDYFDGIIAGVYLNGWRLIDMGINQNDIETRGDIHIAKHPFFVPRPV